MDARPSHFAIPGRVVYPRFPGFDLSADKFDRLARPNPDETGRTGDLWYGAKNGDACVYSPSGAFAPKVYGIPPSKTEINGCIHWANVIYRTTDGKWALVVDVGAPAFNPFESWHYEADPEGEEGDTIKVYDGWGWWELTIPTTYDFGSEAGRECTLVPRGTLLNDDHLSDRENPPEVKLEWDAYRRIEKPADETGPGGLYRNEDGDEVSVGNPIWDADDPALSRLVGIRLEGGGMRYLADGRGTATLSDGRVLLSHGKLYVSHERPHAKQSIRFVPCDAYGQEIEPTPDHRPFTAEWHGFMSVIRPKSVAYAFELPTVVNDAGEES